MKINNIRGRLFRYLPLRCKFYLIIVTLLVMMGVAITAVTFRMTSSLFHEKLISDTETISSMIAVSSVRLQEDPGHLSALIESFRKAGKDILYIYLLSPESTIITSAVAPGFPENLLRQTVPGQPVMTNQSRDLSLAGLSIHETVTPIIAGTVGSVHVGMSEEAMVFSLTLIKSELAGLTVLLCLFGLIAAYLANRLVSNPLADLAMAAERIGKGEFDLELPVERRDEIGTLTRAMNEMAASLRRSQAERKETENTLRNSEKLYRSLIENIHLGISLIDTDHNIIMVNPEQARMLNRPPESIIGKKCYREFERRDQVCGHCPGIKAMSGGSPVEHEKEGILDDGRRLTVKIRAFPINNEAGEPIGFIEVVEDITDQRNTEGELQKVKHIESIGLLAGGLAHDFNNLLTAILGNIELAMAAISPESPAYTRLCTAEDACNQTRKLVGQLLTFNRGGAPRKAITFVPQLLEESCHLALSGSDLKLVLDAANDIWPAELDREQMRQVIQNLLINAREASKPGGKIFVIAENVVIENNPEIPLANGKYIKISVEDEGTAIKGDVLPHIFDPYFTTKEMGAIKGTGLGLTICHSIIKKHGGYISARSTEGVGTSISFYIPKSEENGAAVHPGAALLKAEPANTIHNILLLEDDRELAKTTANMLLHLRHKFEITANGNETVRLYREALAGEHPFDLLLLDLTIRGGMSGNETLQKILAEDPRARAIVSSGYSDDQIMLNFRNYGFAGALAKPFSLSELDGAIRNAFGQRLPA